MFHMVLLLIGAEQDTMCLVKVTSVSAPEMVVLCWMNVKLGLAYET